MSDPKEFATGIDSDQRRSPKRIVFVTRRTSAQVKVISEDEVQTFPEVLFRAALATIWNQSEAAARAAIRAIPDGTELTFTHSRLHDEESRRGHERGWNGSLDKLERHFLASSNGGRHDQA